MKLKFALRMAMNNKRYITMPTDNKNNFFLRHKKVRFIRLFKFLGQQVTKKLTVGKMME